MGVAPPVSAAYSRSGLWTSQILTKSHFQPVPPFLSFKGLVPKHGRKWERFL